MLTPGEQLGHYEILERVGSDGMSSVYRARDTLVRRTVAIKLLQVATGSELPARLLREARAASALTHPNICQVHGLEEADGHAFIVMEFVEGESLRVLSRRGLPFEQTLVYARQIAAAVGYAHRQGVVHRGLKTSSVLITSNGQAKVLDFGIASQVMSDDDARDASPVSPAGLEAWAGTLPYMAPERLRGEPGGQQSDVWSLGIMFWEMSAGERPFVGDSPAGIQSAILFTALVSPPLTWPDSFMAIVFRCLSKSEDGRYRDAAALSAALQAVPLTAAEHTWSRWRSVTIGVAAGVAVLAVSVTGFVYLPRAPRERTEPVVPAQRAGAPVSASQRTRLAILPFRPLDRTSRDAPLELGLADALITAISGLPGVTVRPTSAVLRFADHPTDATAAGRDLHVEGVVEGSVQKIRSRLHVSVRLLNVADGRSLWGETFEAPADDLLTVQDAIARRIAQRLLPEVDQRTWRTHAGTKNVDAYRAYLEGRFSWNQRTVPGFRTAIEHFRRATALDPDYAPAYAGIADCLTLLGIWGVESIAKSVEQARGSALHAVLADDLLPEAHGSLALVRWIYDWNWPQAEREFKRALELNPSYATAHQWYAYFLASRGRFPEALAAIQQARELDPLSLSIRTDVGEINAWARHYDTAVAELRGVVDADPDFPMAHNILGLTYVLQGRLTDGITALERARQIDDGPRMMSTLAYAYGVAGNHARARALLRELQSLTIRRNVSPFAFALVHAGLGERNEALAWLQRAFHERSDTMAIIGVYPWLDGLRSDPRFADLLQQTEANRYQ